NRIARFVRVRLGTRARLHIPHQSLRSLRTPSSLAATDWKAVYGTAIRHARTIQARASSVVRRMVLRVLEHADDDHDPSALRGDDDGVHSRGHPVRRARPRALPSGVRELLSPRSDAHSVYESPPGRRAPWHHSVWWRRGAVKSV